MRRRGTGRPGTVGAGVGAFARGLARPLAGAPARGAAGAALALLAAVALVAPAAAPASPPSSFDPSVEAQNYSITLERQTIYDTPEYQAQLTAAGYGRITTEILAAPEFYYAEDYHQQYLAKNPGGYCGLGGTGVSCPVGVGVNA